MHASDKKTVLIVEDNRDAADSLAMLLQIKGHQALIASDAETGLVLAHAVSPDVIVHDINLPRMSGYEAVRRLRADANLVHTTFVALTGYATPADRARALAEGFDVHLSKPMDIADLDRILDQVDQGRYP